MAGQVLLLFSESSSTTGAAVDVLNVRSRLLDRAMQERQELVEFVEVDATRTSSTIRRVRLFS